ncbi:MAG: 2-hydroxycarboxylate transporter family protein [Solobacterium sp.]|nr:2-hydroxycarboxylate transporter family protein [Solobacterium sp.]
MSTEKTQTKILGFPWWMIAVMAVVFMILGKTDKMITNMVGALGFALVVGSCLGWLGNHIPVWNTWLGGGMLFTSLAAGAFNTFHLLGENTVAALNTFNGGTGFLNLYILVLITGSVLSIDRKMLIKSFAGYIPTILGGIVVSFLFCGIFGMIFGIGFWQSIMDFAMPIMGGGNGAGITPMSKMYAAALGLEGDAATQAASAWWAKCFAVTSIGNLFSVISAALLNKIGDKKPEWNGHGQLMKTEGNIGGGEDPIDKVHCGPQEYACGLALALFCFQIATFYGKNISLINHAGWNFSIHEFAFMVILVAILNISGIIPVEIRAGARAIQRFFVNYMSFPLMITVGIGASLTDYLAAFSNFGNLICMIVTVIGAMVGTFLVGKLFHFYPIEGMITAGLCMANGGGSGDVQVLGACNRMDMMSYAQISSRIGGASILVIASVLFGAFV